MRKLMILLILLIGAASADAAEPRKWCSDGFDKPAVFSGIADGWLLTVGGKKIETFDNEDEGFHFRTLMASEGLEDLPQADIVIVHDRVFWPCSSTGTSTGMPHNE